MSDPIERQAEKMGDEIVERSKDQQKIIKKMKAISKLNRDIGLDTSLADKFIGAADDLLGDLIKKFDRHPEKE